MCVCVGGGGGVNDDPSFCTPWIRFVAKKNHMQKRIKIYIYMYYTDGIEKKMSAEQERFNAAPSFT